MRLSDLSTRDTGLFETIPPIGSVPPVAGSTNTTPATGVQGNAATQTDPQNAARAAQQRQEQIRQKQAEIRQTEQHLIALRKQLAEIQR